MSDPLGGMGEMYRQIMQAQKRMEDLHDSPTMRAMRSIEQMRSHMMTVTPPTDSLNMGVALASTLAREKITGLMSVLDSTAWMDQRGDNARSMMTSALRVNGILDSATAARLQDFGYLGRAANMIAPSVASPFRGVAELTKTLAWRDPVGPRLGALGIDPLTGATLATAGLAFEAFRVRSDLTARTNTLHQTLLGAQSLGVTMERFQSFTSLSTATESLWKHASAPSALAGLPGYLAFAPTLEPYASARTLSLFLRDGPLVELPLVMDLIAEEFLDGVSADFESRLASADQGLLRPVRGAWTTALSDSEDRVRQVSVSIRHALDMLIVRLAPDDLTKAWMKQQALGRKAAVPAEAKDFRSASKKAPQLRYIMRNADAATGDSLLSYLVEADFVDMLALLEQLNQAVHEGDGKIAEDDLALVLRRAMAFMTLLLDAYEFEL
jgi:hypothetical protein